MCLLKNNAAVVCVHYHTADPMTRVVTWHIPKLLIGWQYSHDQIRLFWLAVDLTISNLIGLGIDSRFIVSRSICHLLRCFIDIPRSASVIVKWFLEGRSRHTFENLNSITVLTLSKAHISHFTLHGSIYLFNIRTLILRILWSARFIWLQCGQQAMRLGWLVRLNNCM